MSFKLSSVFSLLCASILLVGCSETPVADDADANKADPATADDAKKDEGAKADDADAGTTEFANAYCPIMLHAISGKGEVTTWNDQTIGYCCDGCKEKFEKLSDDDKKTALAKADEAAKKEASETDDKKDETKTS
jgi:PBP1b-binding outer membrane lipoprotein LpoB